MQYLSGRDTTLYHDARKSWRGRIALAIAESKEACRRHLIDPIPEVRHFFPDDARYVYEEGQEGRVTALLVAEHNNVPYRQATRAGRKPGGRGTLVFNLHCADLQMIMTEKEVQELFKAAIRMISNTFQCASTGPCQHTQVPSIVLPFSRWIRPAHVPACAPALTPPAPSPSPDRSAEGTVRSLNLFLFSLTTMRMR